MYTLAKPNIGMSPCLTLYTLAYYAWKGSQELLHNLNPIKVAPLAVVRHLPRPHSIAKQRTIHVIKLILRGEPEPKVIIDAHSNVLSKPP
jgi:hypothetical protein